MILKEMKKKIEQLLAEKYEQITVNGERCFRKPDGTVFILSEIASENSLVVEYADDIDQARQNAYEDGDWYCITEYEDDKLISEILREIG